MGQRGPAPEPVALRLLKGETRPSQLNKGPVDQEPPVKPKLDAEAGKVWDAILACTSHIGQAHSNALRLYSETTATLNAMNPKGSKEWRELVLIHLRLARELCLTPATAGNLKANTKPAEKKLTKYVS